MSDATTRKIEGREHQTTLNGQKIYIWEKPAAGGATNGTLLLIHGSTMHCRPSFDLQVAGMPEASAMNWFASRGFDVWSFDCRGYGRSYKEPEYRGTIFEGADDAKAVSDFILKRNGGKPMMVYGISSGALRAAVFAERHPERVARLAMDAMVWTGEGSPTLEQRRKNLDQFRQSTRRPVDRAFLLSIFNRDHPGTAHDAFIDPFVDQVLECESTVPTGTYVDMCANLPVCDPTRIKVPAIVMRGEYDGIASMEDLLKFFALLPNPNKEFTVMPGVAHASFTQKNFLLVYQTLYGFITRAEPVYKGT